MFKKIKEFAESVAAEPHLARHDRRVAKHFADGGTVEVIYPDGSSEIETEFQPESHTYRALARRNSKR
ncbi:hypothetical protein ACQEVX_24875 [Streptomyces syringium]|uniref:hypothetical protein n=1 Tax=Streptomyces syringium TaxID=76729 RepID=UPI003D9053C9